MPVLGVASFQVRWLLPRAPFSFPIQACQSMESSSSSSESHKVFKQLGHYSFRKKIMDAVTHAEVITPTALEIEEARRSKHEEVLQDLSLWDDMAKSVDCFAALADATKLVNGLKDLRCKVEEAKLIMELAEMDVISHELFKQAYMVSLDVNRFLERYEILKLLNGPYDKEGAYLTIKAGAEGVASEVWAEKLLRMYIRWAEKHGCSTMIVERYAFMGPETKTVAIQFESEYMYGYLSGEKGVHRKICRSLDESAAPKICSAVVNVYPHLLGSSIDMPIGEDDIQISYFSSHKKYPLDSVKEHAVSIHHIPSGITAQSSGERSSFANRVKSLNRLKAKLLVLERERHASDHESRSKRGVHNELNDEIRRYVFHPRNMVEDVRTGVQVADSKSVLNGNVEPFMRAHISHRHGRETTANDMP